MKILVIQQKMIGDVLASSVICNNLKKIDPASTVHFLAYKHTIPVIENNPSIDEIIIFEEEYRNSKIKFLKFLLQIRKRNYDVVIDAYGKLESNLVVLFSGASKKIGLYRKHSHFLFTNTIQENYEATSEAGAAIDNRLNLLTPINTTTTFDRKPKIFLTEEEIILGKETLLKNNIDLSKKIYMISIIGSEVRKTYPKKYMAKVLDLIVKETYATLLFNYIPKQYDEVKEIIELCEPKTRNFCKSDLMPGSIRNFLSITHHCNALIGNEGGAVNMAKAIDIPTFTIFSPWIIKEAWNSFENEKTTISVHLKDFKPELYKGKHAFEFKNQALTLYDEFKPTLFEEQLKKFLKIN